MRDPSNASDNDLIFNALHLYANWIETSNPIISAQDAERSSLPFNALTPEQTTLVGRLRTIADNLRESNDN